MLYGHKSEDSAMENIIKDLCGPADATPSFFGATGPGKGATTRVVYANACNQTEPVAEESLQNTGEMYLTVGKCRATATAV